MIRELSEKVNFVADTPSSRDRFVFTWPRVSIDECCSGYSQPSSSKFAVRVHRTNVRWADDKFPAFPQKPCHYVEILIYISRRVA